MPVSEWAGRIHRNYVNRSTKTAMLETVVEHNRIGTVPSLSEFRSSNAIRIGFKVSVNVVAC